MGAARAPSRPLRHTSRCGEVRTEPTTDSVERDVTPHICYRPFPFTRAKSCTIFAVLSRALNTADELRLRTSKSFVEVSQCGKKKTQNLWELRSGLPLQSLCRRALIPSVATGMRPRHHPRPLPTQ